MNEVVKRLVEEQLNKKEIFTARILTSLISPYIEGDIPIDDIALIKFSRILKRDFPDITDEEITEYFKDYAKSVDAQAYNKWFMANKFKLMSAAEKALNRKVKISLDTTQDKVTVPFY